MLSILIHRALVMYQEWRTGRALRRRVREYVAAPDKIEPPVLPDVKARPIKKQHVHGELVIYRAGSGEYLFDYNDPWNQN